MENKNESFNYTYSANEQAELQRIRQKYVPKELNKMEQLRKLDQSVTQKGIITALTLGIIGAIIMGIGMSLCMTDIGEIIGIDYTMPVGVLIGIIGIAVIIAVYPVYCHIIKKERAKIAPEIIRLTDELSK